jgi:hypothetical protein
MQFSVTTLMVLAASLVSVNANLLYSRDLPDGSYVQTIYPNGTRVTEASSVKARDIGSISELDKKSTLIPSAKFGKRQFSCGLFPGAGDCDTNCDGNGGLDLDHPGIDGDYVAMKAACPYTIDTKDHNTAQMWITNGVMTYLCTDGHYSANTFTADMVQTALERMDAKCNLYESSWYIFPNSNAIIGKANAGYPVCQGGSWGSKM